MKLSKDIDYAVQQASIFNQAAATLLTRSKYKLAVLVLAQVLKILERFQPESQTEAWHEAIRLTLNNLAGAYKKDGNE